MLGLYYPTPLTTLGRRKASFSKASLSILAVSCFLMSANTFLEVVHDNMLAAIDVIANTAAFIYLLVLYTEWVYEGKTDIHVE